MLRILSVVFFVAGVLEVGLMIAGKLNLTAGLLAISFALFFGGVIFALDSIQRDVQAIRKSGMATKPGHVEEEELYS